MKNARRILFYLVLNFIVSASATLLVLVLWQQTHHTVLPEEVMPGNGNLSGEVTATLFPTATPTQVPLPSLDKPLIEVKAVIGVGDINHEVVEWVRLGEGDLWLTGWQMRDEEGNFYTFPNLLLNQGGSIRVYTRAGADSVIELYWNQSKPMWRPGERVTLIDYAGHERASYFIP